MWGYEKSDKRAQDLEDIVIPAGLEIAPITEPTLISGNGRLKCMIDILAFTMDLPITAKLIPFTWSDHDMIRGRIPITQ